MNQLVWLNEHEIDFPDPNTALTEPNGLLAAGGDLSPERLLKAYHSGIFPWFDDEQPILWWSPNPRTVLFPEKIHLSRSLKKRLRKQEFTVTCDTAFQQVIQHCAYTSRKDQTGTWITTEMMNAYQHLHHLGYAHSIETWQDGQLVGGLYGLSIGRAFFGESMFSLTTDASKVAFCYLAKQLSLWNFGIIDCQVGNPHLFSLGAEDIDRKRFNEVLSASIKEDPPTDWEISCDPLSSS